VYVAVVARHIDVKTGKERHATMTTFSVTYELVNEDEAAEGGTDRRGFASEDTSLRDAIISLFSGDWPDWNSVEANEYPVTCPRSITVYGSMSWRTGDYETRTLHIPDDVTPSSRRRIVRLLGACK
jgi:hypothetical protein